MSIKERSPFIRTLSIWQERKVLSASFCEKLKSYWETVAASTHGSSQKLKPLAPTSSVDKRLLHGDPKISDCGHIKERLSRQTSVTKNCLGKLASSLPKNESQLYIASDEKHHIEDPLIAIRLLTSLTMEVAVRFSDSILAYSSRI